MHAILVRCYTGIIRWDQVFCAGFHFSEVTFSAFMNNAGKIRPNQCIFYGRCNRIYFIYQSFTDFFLWPKPLHYVIICSIVTINVAPACSCIYGSQWVDDKWNSYQWYSFCLICMLRRSISNCLECSIMQYSLICFMPPYSVIHVSLNHNKIASQMKDILYGCDGIS